MHGKNSWIVDELKKSGIKTGISAILAMVGGKLKGVDSLAKCSLCPNMCRFACPVSLVEGRETTSPAGKARIALFVERDFLELDADNVEPLYHCLSCDSCMEWCSFEFSVSELTLAVRERVSLACLLPAGLRKILDNIERYGYAFGKPVDDSLGHGKGDVLYIRGCMVREYYPELAEKTVKVIESLGYEAFTPEGETCCGLIAYESGETRLAREIAVRNAKWINGQDAKLIVTSCPSCAYAYHNIYPGLGVRIRKRVQCTAEFLLDSLTQATARENLEVIIHDPCRLARGLGMPEALKNILERVDGLEVRTPMRSGVNTFCCGYGGTLSRVREKISSEIACTRIRELEEEAKTIVTACPTCKWALSKAGGKVYDLMELLYDSHLNPSITSS